MIINILKEINSNAATGINDGKKIFNVTNRALKDGKNVILDFKKIKFISPTFLNIAIGRLYGIYEKSFLSSNLKVVHMNNNDLIMLNRVIKNANEYIDKLAKEYLDRFMNWLSG